MLKVSLNLDKKSNGTRAWKYKSCSSLIIQALTLNQTRLQISELWYSQVTVKANSVWICIDYVNF